MFGLEMLVEMTWIYIYIYIYIYILTEGANRQREGSYKKLSGLYRGMDIRVEPLLAKVD